MFILSDAARESLKVICDPEKYNTIVFQDFLAKKNGNTKKLSECILRSQQIKLQFFDNEAFLVLFYINRNQAEYDKLLTWLDKVQKDQKKKDDRITMFTLVSSYEETQVYMSGMIDRAHIKKYPNDLAVSFEIPTDDYGLYRYDPSDTRGSIQRRNKEVER